MHVTGDTETNTDCTLRPRGRDTINELLDPVLPDNPRPHLLRSDRGGYWEVAQLLSNEAPWLTLCEATLVDHEPDSIEHLSD